MEKRNSNFEVLRIISIILITLHHITFTLGIDSDNMYLRMWAQFFYIGGKVGVNCFVLISGYFLSQRKFKMERIIKIYTKVVAYCLVGLAIGYLVNGGVGVFDIIKSLLPITFNTYWFVSAYIGMIMFSPVLNFIAEKFTIQQFTTLIICSLTLFTFMPTLTTQTTFNNNLTWFCFMYLLAAYLRKYNTKLKYYLSKAWVFPVMWMLIWGASVVFTIGEAWIPELREGTNFFTGMYILPQLLNSVSLFLIFEKKEISSKVINYLGKHTFAGYLVQSNFIFSAILAEYYLKVFNCFSDMAYPLIVPILGLSVFVFAVVADMIFDVLLNSRLVHKVQEIMVRICNGVICRLRVILETRM